MQKVERQSYRTHKLPIKFVTLKNPAKPHSITRRIIINRNFTRTPLNRQLHRTAELLAEMAFEHLGVLLVALAEMAYCVFLALA